MAPYASYLAYRACGDDYAPCQQEYYRCAYGSSEVRVYVPHANLGEYGCQGGEQR